VVSCTPITVQRARRERTDTRHGARRLATQQSARSRSVLETHLETNLETHHTSSPRVESTTCADACARADAARRPCRCAAAADTAFTQCLRECSRLIGGPVIGA